MVNIFDLKNTNLLEFFLVKFPLLFPLTYGLILYVFPEYEIYLIFFTLLFLAETHFGATWPFFLNKSNENYLKKNKFNLIYIPLVILSLSIIGFFLFKKIFFLIFFMANMYHVTRQSFGVCKLYTKQFSEIKFQEIFIYLFSFIFFLVGFFRFYYPLIKNDYLFLLNSLILILIFCALLIYCFYFKISSNLFSFATGILIFYPICFLDDPIHAIIMGVTMHYTQYLYLTHKVFMGRKKDKIINTSLKNYIFIIFLYAFFMSIFSLFARNTNELFSMLILIPITGQMLHFYLDSQLWKFSSDHNKTNVLKYLF